MMIKPLGVAVTLAASFFSSNALALEGMTIQVNKVPKSTMVDGSAVGNLDVSYEKLVAALCDYDQGGEFAPDDPVEFQRTVSTDYASFLTTNVPEDRDEVKAEALKGTVAPNCPEGESFLVALIDLPWPLSDAWQLSKFTASSTTAETTLKFDFIVGTAKESSGYFKVRKLPDGKAELTNVFHFDVGMRIPEFLIRWGVKSALPDYFEAMEAFAQAYSLPVTQ